VGCRIRDTGALGYVGERGHWWSSSSFAAGHVDAGLLWYRPDLVNPLDNSNRANAFAVRCVQHLRLLIKV